ncbi:MDR family MFS transporter [Promicromonospora iranensis]|uniref:DHA2 family lincomycin resistance protein-like MFS transporter n=1 Tax=Promicromonospora iranensis TaxID=1105144 RepID=A0ABU2CPP5_9MICO|nr:MDR family MFS transporter [Promicromonospora iranensis]MDR7383324.1 DHA2 family lincomycin resistance protein-like MFS transporter [Promicromonospora iranensis]
MSTDIIDTSDHVNDPPHTPATSAGAPSGAPAPTRTDKLGPGHFRVIALLMASAFTVILNETTMSVALPPIMADLQVTESTGQWLTTAFMLTMAVVIPATGFLINRLGTRGAYLLAMSLFTAGTALAMVAPGFALLVTGRVVQATGTAIMLPLLMTTIMSIVPAHMRGRVMGNVTLVIALAPALGPTLSGIVLEPLGWRGVFGVVLPISVLALTAGILWIRDVSDRETMHLDPLSLLLALVAFGGLVWGLSGLGEAAETAALINPWIPLGVGIAVLGLFVWRQIVRQRTESALLDLRTFLQSNFRLAVVIMAISMMAMFGTMIVLPLVLQNAVGMEPLTVGLLMLPGGVAMGLLGPVVGRWYDRFGPRPIMIPGTAMVTVAIGAFAFLTPTTPLYYILGAHILLMIGLASVFTPLFSAALGVLEPHLYSHGSATISTVQQVAGAAGVALFIAIMTIRRTALEDSGIPTPEAMASGAGLAFGIGALLMAATIGVAAMIKRPESDGEFSGGH